LPVLLFISGFALLIGYSHHIWRRITDSLPAKWNWQCWCHYSHVCWQLWIWQGQNPWRCSGSFFMHVNFTCL